MVDPASVSLGTLLNEAQLVGHAMGSRISLTAVSTSIRRAELVDLLGVGMDEFAAVDRECTRFDPSSSLMRANRAGERWVEVDRRCAEALQAAETAYTATGHRFDPRVHDDLVRLGYDRSRRFGPISPRWRDALSRRPALPDWQPEFDHAHGRVRIGPRAVDLGGIAKGYGVDQVASLLSRSVDGLLVEAGGDCWCGGVTATGEPWRIAVEDPHGGPGPVAVLALTDRAVATSSTRVCSWEVDGVEVHHLIDPRTGLPGGEGLAAVTVVAIGAMTAEVWSKVLFLEGVDGIAKAADDFGVPCLWVDTERRLHATADMSRYLIWRGDE